MPTIPDITRGGKTFAQASAGITDRNALGALARTYQNPEVTPTPPAPGGSTTSGNVNSGYYSRTNKGLQEIVTDPGDAPNLNNIRNELNRNNQAVIDSIKAQYAGTIAEERARGDVLNKRQRAANVNSGVGGSDFASANAQKTEDSNLNAIRTIEQERDAKIAATLAGVEFRASEMFQERKNQYRQDAEASIEKTRQFKEDALDDIANFASSGMTAAQLKEKSPDTWKALIEQTGYDDMGLTAAFIKNKPEPDFKEKVGNSLIYGYRDPQTGKITTEKIALAEGYDSFEKVGDGYYFVDTAGGRLKAAGVSGGSSGGGSGTSTASRVTAVQNTLKTGIAPSGEKIGNGRGKDGYTDPYVYIAAFENWPGTTQEFTTKFPIAKNVNPASYKILPEAIRPAAKKTTTTTTSSSSSTGGRPVR